MSYLDTIKRFFKITRNKESSKNVWYNSKSDRLILAAKNLNLHVNGPEYFLICEL